MTCSPVTQSRSTRGQYRRATVDDVDGGAEGSSPAGSVDFSRSGAGAGNFSFGVVHVGGVGVRTARLPARLATGRRRARGRTRSAAAYQGSSTHAISDDDVDGGGGRKLRTTATTVTCSPPSGAINEGTVCTAVVDDTDGGMKSSPSGTVTSE